MINKAFDNVGRNLISVKAEEFFEKENKILKHFSFFTQVALNRPKGPGGTCKHINVFQ